MSRDSLVSLSERFPESVLIRCLRAIFAATKRFLPEFHKHLTLSKLYVCKVLYPDFSQNLDNRTSVSFPKVLRNLCVLTYAENNVNFMDSMSNPFLLLLSNSFLALLFEIDHRMICFVLV